MLCENCNSEMEYFKSGNSCGWNCPKCGNGIVTSNIDTILMDDTIYSIQLEALPMASTDQLRAISKIGSMPILDAKKLANSGGQLIEGNAVDIKEAIKSLRELSFVFDITPDFPHSV